MMSSIQSIVNVAQSDISAISGLFGSNSVVSLDEFSFANFEIPETISLGGSQHTTVHELPGGNRIIHTMGGSDREIAWRGVFLSADALTRASTLDQKRIAGKAVVLKTLNLTKNCIISSFTFDPKQNNNVPYSISLTVISNVVVTPKPSLLTSIENDIGSALGVNIPAAISQVQTAVAQVQKVAQAASVLTGGSAASLGVLGALNSATSITSQISTTANTALGAASSALSGAGSTGSSSSVTGAVSSIQSLVSNSGIVAATGDVLSYVGRAAKNLVNPSNA